MVDHIDLSVKDAVGWVKGERLRFDLTDGRISIDYVSAVRFIRVPSNDVVMTAHPTTTSECGIMQLPDRVRSGVGLQKV